MLYRQIFLLFLFLTSVISLNAGVAVSDSSVEINLEALENYTPPPMFEGLSQQAPLTAPHPKTGKQPSGSQRLEQAAPNKIIIQKPKVPAVRQEEGMAFSVNSEPPPPQAKPRAESRATENKKNIASFNIPPIPRRRPDRFLAPQSFIEKAKAEYRNQDSGKETAKNPIKVAQKPRSEENESESSKPLKASDLKEPTAADVLATISPAAGGAPKDLRIEKKGNVISFDFDKREAELSDKLRKQLLDKVKDLKNARTRIEIHAFATVDKQGESAARRLSLARALSVRAFLIENDFSPRHIDVRALGTEDKSFFSRKSRDRVDIIIRTGEDA